MLIKILTGLALAVIALAAVLWAPGWVLAILLGGVVLAALVEFVTLPGPGRRFDAVVSGIGGLAILLAAVLGDEAGIGMRIAGTTAFAAIGGLLAILARPGATDQAGHRAAQVVSGLVYVAFLGALATLLVREERGMEGRYALLMVAVVTWLNDTMAYFGGKLMGRHKMAPRVSPNKTWEGSAWGMVGSVVGALVVRALAWPEVALWPVVGFALVGGALGQAGDLVESLFKRTFAVKDSANLLPGHGGFLDRIDAFLFTAPIGYYWFFQWFN